MTDKPTAYNIDQSLLDLFLVIPWPQPRDDTPIRGVFGQNENYTLCAKVSELEQRLIYDVCYDMLDMSLAQFVRWIILHACVSIIVQKEEQGHDVSKQRAMIDILPTIIDYDKLDKASNDERHDERDDDHPTGSANPDAPTG